MDYSLLAAADPENFNPSKGRTFDEMKALAEKIKGHLTAHEEVWVFPYVEEDFAFLIRQIFFDAQGRLWALAKDPEAPPILLNYLAVHWMDFDEFTDAKAMTIKSEEEPVAEVPFEDKDDFLEYNYVYNELYTRPFV